MKKKFLSLILCLTLTASAFGAVVPYAEAADGNTSQPDKAAAQKDKDTKGK